MNIGQLWKKLRWSVRERGVTGTVRMFVWRARWAVRRNEASLPHPFDLEHGTETGGLVEAENLGGGAGAAWANPYAGVPPSRLRAALAQWRRTLEGTPVEAFCFVDLGCGKGRAMLVASELPFREVVGVELSAALAEDAERNAALWRAAGKARCPLRTVTEDVTGFRLPAGPCLVFIYNSFTGPILEAVLEEMKRKGSEDSGPLFLLYQTEPPGLPFRTEPRMRRLWTRRFAMSREEAIADPVSSPEDLTTLFALGR